MLTIFILFYYFKAFCDEFSTYQVNDETNTNQIELGRGMPSISPQNPMQNPITGSSADKATLYLGTFQILAMPFSSGMIPPPNLGNMPSLAPPSKKD